MRIGDWSSDVCSSDLPVIDFPNGFCSLLGYRFLTENVSEVNAATKLFCRSRTFAFPLTRTDGEEPGVLSRQFATSIFVGLASAAAPSTRRKLASVEVDAVLLLIAKQPSSRTPYRSGAIAPTAIAADACANHPARPLFSAPQLRNDTPWRFWRPPPCPLLRSAAHESNDEYITSLIFQPPHTFASPWQFRAWTVVRKSTRLNSS